MKKVVITKHGTPETLQVMETALPEPQAGQVRVKVIVTDIAWADTMARRGQYPTSNKIPYAPGYDIVGIADKLGKGVTTVKIGQRVAALLVKMGGYAEYVCVPEQYLVAVPDTLDSVQAVSVILNGLTAYAALHRVAQVQAGETILITSAAGGVGTMLVQLAKLAGLQVFGSASKEKLTLVRELGGMPIDYKTEKVAERVRQATGGGVDVAIDLVGESKIAASALREGGRLTIVGSLSLKDKKPIEMAANLVNTGSLMVLHRKKRVGFFGDLPKMVEQDPAWYRATLNRLFNLVVEDKLKVIVGKRLPLARAAQGHQLIESGAVIGKIVLEV